MPLPRALLDMAGSLCSIPTAATWWSDGGTFWWHLQCCLRVAWDAINTPKCHVLGHTVELETSCTNKVNYSKPNEKWHYENTSSQLDANKVDHGEPKTDVTHTTGYASRKSAWVPPWYLLECFSNPGKHPVQNKQMGVSKNRGILPPKWMVKIMENPIKMDDLGGFPPIFGNTQIQVSHLLHTSVARNFLKYCYELPQVSTLCHHSQGSP